MTDFIYPKPLAKLIEEFQKLPGVGPKSAQRMVFHLLKQSDKSVKELANSIIEAREQIGFCRICSNLTSTNPCELCQNSQRNQNYICVVAEPKDLIALENTREYKGLYHVLQGLISPMEGIGPDKLRIKEFFERLREKEQIAEVILAINPTVEGDATTLYLSRLIKPLGIKVTRLAFGLPVGGELEYADTMTLAKALEGRREI